MPSAGAGALSPPFKREIKPPQAGQKPARNVKMRKQGIQLDTRRPMRCENKQTPKGAKTKEAGAEENKTKVTSADIMLKCKRHPRDALEIFR